VDRVVGVDLSPEMVRAARGFTSDQGIENVDFVVLDDKTPPFPENSFDVVNCVWVLKYILSDAEAATTIAELSRATKPGGYVALIEQVNRSRDLFVENEGYFQGQALYRTPEFYIDAFGECGMRLRHHAITNASPLFWAYSRLRRLIGAPPGTGPPRRITAVSVHGDLLAGRVMRFRSGHHFFLFQKQEEPVNYGR
jgi:SAM-dependent methyltransferase